MSEPSGKTRARKIAIRALIVLAGVCVAISLAIKLFFPAEKIKETLTKRLSERLGHDVSIESVSLGFYPDIEIVAREVQVIDPATSQLLLSTGRIRIDMSLTQLLRKKYVIENITIGSPTINLIRGADGKWNIAKLFPPEKAGADTAPEGKDASMPDDVDIGPIRIRNGDVRFRDEASGLTVSVTRIKAEIDIERDTIALFSALVSLPAADAKLSGTVDRFSKPGRVFRVKSDARVKKLGPLAGFGPKRLKAGRKIADVSLSVSGPMTEMAVDGLAAVDRRAAGGMDAWGTLRGTLLTNEGVFEVAALDLAYGQSKISFAGACSDLWSGERAVRLGGTGEIQLAEVVRPAGADIISTIEPGGEAKVGVELTASMKGAELETDFDLTDAAFTIPMLMRKHAGAPGSLKAAAHYSASRELVVDGFEIALGDVSLSGNARVGPGAKSWAQASVRAEDFPMEALDRLPSVRFEEGTLSFEGQAWQRSREEPQIKYQGNATVERALLTAPELNVPVDIEMASIEFEKNKARLEVVSFSFAGSECTAAAEIVDFSSPQITGEFHADTLDLNEIASAFAKDDGDTGSGTSRPARGKPKGSPDASLEILIDAGSLCVGNLQVGPISTTLKGSDGRYMLAPFDVEVFGGRLTGSIELDPSGKNLRWATDFEGSDISLEKMADQFQEGEVRFDGLLSGKGSLTGEAASATEQVLGSIDGSLELTIADGEIRQYVLLKNIFLLMQFSPATLLVPVVREITALNIVIDAAKTRGRSLDPTCIVFNRIDGSFEIEDGVAHTEDLRLESGIADLLFKGDVDLGKDSLDLRITATPLGSVGWVIGKIPFAGKKLRQAKEAVLSIDFIARGPISDPEVKLAAAESLRPRGEQE